MGASSRVRGERRHGRDVAAQQKACRPSLAIELARTGRTAGRSRIGPDVKASWCSIRVQRSEACCCTRECGPRAQTGAGAPGLKPGPDSLRLPFRALMSRLGRAGQIVRRVDEARHVRTPAGNFRRAVLPARRISLGEQPDVVAKLEQPLEQLLRVLQPSCEDVRVSQPEAAREECAFARRQPVVACEPCRSATGIRRAAGLARPRQWSLSRAHHRRGGNPSSG